jgi:serine phosphatase RsbU (regulator of sigma subunit)
MWIPKIPFFNKRGEKAGYRRPVPTVFPTIEGVQMAALYKGARTGGDFYDAVTTPTRVVFLMLDIAGKREEALHIAAHVQDKFRASAPKQFESADVNEAVAATDLLLEVNRTIIDAVGGTHFSAGFLGCYSLAYGTLCYINAGHTPALLKDSSGVSLLGANGLPLGLFSHATHDAQMCVLEPGAALVLVSRGIVECKHRRREFGIESMKEVLASTPTMNPNDVCSAALAAVEEFGDGASEKNDQTTLTLIRPAIARASMAAS